MSTEDVSESSNAVYSEVKDRNVDVELRTEMLGRLWEDFHDPDSASFRGPYSLTPHLGLMRNNIIETSPDTDNEGPATSRIIRMRHWTPSKSRRNQPAEKSVLILFVEQLRPAIDPEKHRPGTQLWEPMLSGTTENRVAGFVDPSMITKLFHDRQENHQLWRTAGFFRIAEYVGITSEVTEPRKQSIVDSGTQHEHEDEQHTDTQTAIPSKESEKLSRIARSKSKSAVPDDKPGSMTKVGDSTTHKPLEQGSATYNHDTRRSSLREARKLTAKMQEIQDEKRAAGMRGNRQSARKRSAPEEEAENETTPKRGKTAK